MAAPPLADIAASVALSDRTEMRVRQPGDIPTEPSLDVSTVPDARLTLAWPQLGFTLRYDPRLTYWDVTQVGARPTWLNEGSAHLDWHASPVVTLSLDEEASYGATSFAGLVFSPVPEGTQPRVDVIPSSQILLLESSSTTLGSHVTLRRWDFRSEVGYQLSGGADDSARAILPLQRGPLADAVLTYATSHVDHVATTLSASETTFSSGPQITLAEGDESWRRAWSAVTETDVTVGFSGARERVGPYATAASETDPVAEVVLEQRVLSREDRLTFRVGARLGPVINRLLGIVDERVQGTLVSNWIHGPFTVHALGGAEQSVPTDGPNATTLYTGELSLSYAAVEGVVFDMGVRGLWQRAAQPLTPDLTAGASDIVEASIGQGLFFVGVTFSAPTIRL
jgi:hypothetical protein